MTRAAAAALTLASILLAVLLLGRARQAEPRAATARSMTLVCLGDSNTAAPSSWCGQLAAVLPESWRVVNRAVGGAVVDHPGGWQNGREQLEASLAADDPDVLVFAFGTNDLMLSFAYRARERSLAKLIQPIVAGYERLAQRGRRSGARVFVALTPPFCTGRDFSPGINRFVRALNGAIEKSFRRAEIIDFHTPVAADDYVGDDCVHLNAQGQRKRLGAACAALARAGVARCRPLPAQPPA
jgi:lysophospholipase L1-like esterase